MPWTSVSNPPKLNKVVIRHLVLFLIGLIGVLYALYQGLALLSMMNPNGMQMTLINMERKQSIIDMNRFVYTGNEEHYNASQARLTNLINYRDAMSQHMFQKEIPLSAEQKRSIRIFNPKIEESASIVQLYVGLFFGLDRAQGVWNQTSEILRSQQLLGSEVYDAIKSGQFDQTALAEYERQIQQFNLSYDDSVLSLVENMLRANDRIRYFIFGIITFLAISLTIFAERITRSRMRHARELYRYEEINERYRKFPETNPNPVISIGHDGALTYFNAAAEKSFPNLSILKEHHPFMKAIMLDIGQDLNTEADVEFRHVEYKEKHYDIMMRKAGTDLGYHAYVFDSSVVYEQKNEIEANLREKELLISEIHHRVNNNLAIILGFLELSAQQMVDPMCRRLNDLNMARIRTVSIINRALYEHGDFTNVDFSEHLSYLEHTNGIKVSIQAEKRLVLNVNQAFSLALLLNEIIQELRFVGCCNDVTLAVGRNGDYVRMTLTSPDLANFTVPENDIMQLMISQLGVDWNGRDMGPNALTFKFDVRDVSGAMATRQLSNGRS